MHKALTLSKKWERKGGMKNPRWIWFISPAQKAYDLRPWTVGPNKAI